MAAARGLARPVVDARQIFRCVQALSFFHKEKGNGMTAHPPSRAGVEAQLRSSELFGSFSKKALAALLDNAAMLSLGRGKAVYRQGDDATDVCVLLQGGVKLCAETRGFRPKVLEFIHPVGVFGLFDILGDRIRDLSAFTLSQSEILRVDGQYFRRQLERDAGLSLNLLKAWGVRFREFSTWCFRYNHFGAAAGSAPSRAAASRWTMYPPFNPSCQADRF